MFKIDPSPTFTANVKLTVPGQDVPALVAFEFRHQGRAALKAWLDRAAGETDAALLGDVIAGWQDVADAKGAPLAYGAKPLAALLDAYPAAGAEIFHGYLAALTESRAKN